MDCSGYLISSGVCLHFDIHTWPFGFTILYFSSLVWLWSYNIYALLISIIKWIWLLNDGEHSVHSVFHLETWKTDALTFCRTLGHFISRFVSPHLSFLSFPPFSLFLSLLGRTSYKSEISIVQVCQGNNTQFSITESLSLYKQPSLESTKVLVPEQLCKRAGCPEVTMQWGTQASQRAQVLCSRQHSWFRPRPPSPSAR